MDTSQLLMLNGMTHAQLLSLRNSLAADDPLQGILGPIEHRAFARESTAENPIMAPALLGAIPAYTGAKWLAQNTDLGRATLGQMDYFKQGTPASLDEMAAGYRGLGEGVQSIYTQMKDSVTGAWGKNDDLHRTPGGNTP